MTKDQCLMVAGMCTLILGFVAAFTVPFIAGKLLFISGGLFIFSFLQD